MRPCSSASARLLRRHTRVTDQVSGPFETLGPLTLHCLAASTYAPPLDISLQFPPTVPSISLAAPRVSTQAGGLGVGLAGPNTFPITQALLCSPP